jgi:hypothetical protein
VRIFEERDAGSPSLLRAPADDAVLVNIQITGAGPAAPFILAAVNLVILEPVPAGIATRSLALYLAVNFLFALGKAFVQPHFVVDHAHRR